MNARDAGGPRIIELPYPIGQVVYHCVRTERIPGVLAAFIVTAESLKAIVTWGDDLVRTEHDLFELRTEYVLNPGS